jgi:hypothetical protein
MAVGREHSHERVAMFVHQVNSSKPYGGRGVAARGLGKHVRRRKFAQLAFHGRGLLGIRNNPGVAWLEKRRKTRHRFAKHGLRPDNVEKLLRRAFAAARPEARSTPPGKKDSAGRERLTFR